MTTYVLSYDPVSPRYSIGQLASFIKENRRLAGWYTPFAGTWVLRSDEPFQAVVESFRGFFDGTPYLLTVAHQHQIGGALDPAIWPWINAGIAPPWPPLSGGLLGQVAPK